MVEIKIWKHVHFWFKHSLLVHKFTYTKMSTQTNSELTHLSVHTSTFALTLPELSYSAKCSTRNFSLSLSRNLHFKSWRHKILIHTSLFPGVERTMARLQSANERTALRARTVGCRLSASWTSSNPVIVWDPLGAVVKMTRETGLLVLVWIALFPLHRADNLGE